MKKFLALVSAIVFVGVLLFAQGAQEKKEEYQTLEMYTALDSAEAQFYIEAFTKETGIQVNFVRLGSGECLARIEAEKDNPQASVWFGGSNTEHINAAAKGLLEPYKPHTDFELGEKFHDPDWKWTGFYTGAIGFVSNTKFLEDNGIEAPHSWEALLDPVFEGQIEMAYPYTSGTAYTTLGAIIELKGLDGALEWWKKFDKSIHQYTKSGTGCIARAGLGECGVGIAFSHDIVAKGIKQGYPLVMSFPDEGTGFEVGGLSLIKGGRQPKEAQIFVDWCFGENCQNLFQQYSRLPVNPKAEVAEGAVKLSDIKLVDYDATALGLAKDANVQAWRDAIGK